MQIVIILIVSFAVSLVARLISERGHIEAADIAVGLAGGLLTIGLSTIATSAGVNVELGLGVFVAIALTLALTSLVHQSNPAGS